MLVMQVNTINLYQGLTAELLDVLGAPDQKLKLCSDHPTLNELEIRSFIYNLLEFV